MDERATRRRLIVRGLFWNVLYQAFQIGVTFISMVLLSRIIPPAEYGRAGAAVGVLTLVNALNCHSFVAQALQLGEGVEPDWSAHFGAAFYLQSLLFFICHGVAGICWLFPAYRPIAPLLHIAAIGLIIDWPNQVGGTMLRRNLDFRRLRIAHAIGTFTATGVTLALGLLGRGAVAIVIGGTVIPALPFTIDLLLVRRWRPHPGWWRLRPADYRAPIEFGLQQVGVGLVRGAPGALASVVLPRTVGYAAIGLLNRAHGLIATTATRLHSVIAETVYPLLPRYASERDRYRPIATMFMQIVVWICLPGIFYIGAEGPNLSRLLYGQKWVAMDPLIWPSAVGAVGTLIGTLSATILLAANRLRVTLALEIALALLCVPSLLVTLLGGNLLAYCWALSAGALVAGAINLWACREMLIDGWFYEVLVPPVCAAVAATVATHFAGAYLAPRALPIRWAAASALYGLVVLLVLRVGFPVLLERALARLPRGPQLARWLGLKPPALPPVVDASQ